MKTVTAKSPDGKRKKRVSIEAENGAFSVARCVDFRFGKREEMSRWCVYHTKTGAGLRPDFTSKEPAIKAMNRVAAIKGNWNRSFETLNKDEKLRQQFAEALAWVKVECGDWIVVS